MKGFFTYLKNVRAELKHVVWPSQKQAITHVILILVISAFVAAYIAALDYGFTHAVGAIINGY